MSLDILMNEQNDLQINGGDFVVGPSDQAHIDDILSTEKGEWREWPLLGVGLQKYLNSTGQLDDRAGLLRAVRLQLESDNFQVLKLDVLRRGTQYSISLQATRK